MLLLTKQLLERSLRVLFESCDVSKVKVYVQRQFTKILQNRNSLQDFIFAKEFRGREGYKPGACVPALEISKSVSDGFIHFQNSFFLNLYFFFSKCLDSSQGLIGAPNRGSASVFHILLFTDLLESLLFVW